MPKKDAYYFSHDSNARNDPKVIKLRLSLGWEGYGMYWALLEICKDNNTGDHPWTLESECINQLVMMLLSIDELTAKNLINTLKQSGLFSEENGRFFSKSFIERMISTEEKRCKSRNNGKLGGRPKKEPTGYDQVNQHDNLNITLIKERKGKERKVFIPPKKEEVINYCLERKNGIDADKFIDFYQARSWIMGKTKIKDWKACIRTWEKNNQRDKTTFSGGNKVESTDLRIFE